MTDNYRHHRPLLVWPLTLCVGGPVICIIGYMASTSYAETASCCFFRLLFLRLSIKEDKIGPINANCNFIADFRKNSNRCYRLLPAVTPHKSFLYPRFSHEYSLEFCGTFSTQVST